MTLCSIHSHVFAQGNVLGPNNLIYAGQMIGGTFMVATEGTPIGNANMFPLDRKPAFAIDGNLFTWSRNFGETNTGFIMVSSFNRFGGGTRITQLTLATASDAPERDPLTFTLEGTNGDPLTGAYQLIVAGGTGFAVDPGRHTSTLSSSFPAVGSFLSYRLIFPTVHDPALADSMQIGEIGLRGVAGPEPSVLCLLGISVIGLMGARRRRPNTM